MAGYTIAINATTEGFSVRGADVIGSGLMLVVMMTEVLSSRPGLVLAIASSRNPGELERQKNEKEDGQPAAHGPDSISETHFRKSTAG
ncbi:MAG: hypothetical protein WBH99_05055, partial [Azovibrio sp.]|uniref:hypothetical protein n=1 Tax=Azovibrio sp. TaxID=1872673 RepID=UPI003C7549BB